jgi:hypothetical protein
MIYILAGYTSRYKLEHGMIEGKKGVKKGDMGERK